MLSAVSYQQKLFKNTCMFSSFSSSPAFIAIVSIFAILFLVPVYMAIIRNGHSVSEDLYHMFVYTTCTAFWWKWVTKKRVKQNINI